MHKYTFKPSYIIRNRKDLIGLIKDNQLRGLGGVLKDEVQDSMTTEDFEKVFKVSKIFVCNINFLDIDYNFRIIVLRIFYLWLISKT